MCLSSSGRDSLGACSQGPILTIATTTALILQHLPRPRKNPVLPLDRFIPAIRAAIPRFHPSPTRGATPNPEQETCILHAPAVPLQIVAGPGSGKTTVLVLRALRHVLVDGFLPEQV